MKVVSAEIFISFEKLNDNILILFKPFGKEGLFGSGSIARVKREHPEKKLLAMFRQLFYMLLDPLKIACLVHLEHLILILPWEQVPSRD